jgi:uncharacterized protein (TIGR02453 family)
VATRFAGFPAEMPEFFEGLEKNNNREWFQKRKSVFEEKVKAPMVELVECVNQELAKFAPDHINDPKKAIYRIYRDTRFSKDKTPYKLHVGAIFPHRNLEKHGGGGHYFHVSRKELLLAGGAYMPGKEELLAIREHIAENHERFRKIISRKRLRDAFGELQGDSLVRPPKGFDAEHPAIDLIKQKQWYVFASMGPESATTPELLKEIVKRFKAMQELIDFLNEPLVAQIQSARRDPVRRGR